MVIRVLDDKKADQCDELLTKLIHDERQYDDSIDNDFVVNDYFKNSSFKFFQLCLIIL